MHRNADGGAGGPQVLPEPPADALPLPGGRNEKAADMPQAAVGSQDAPQFAIGKGPEKFEGAKAVRIVQKGPEGRYPLRGKVRGVEGQKGFPNQGNRRRDFGRFQLPDFHVFLPLARFTSIIAQPPAGRKWKCKKEPCK